MHRFWRRGPAVLTFSSSYNASASPDNLLYDACYSLAPATVLEQQLTVPTAPKTLQDALSTSADLLPISVLRVRSRPFFASLPSCSELITAPSLQACLNEACTSALLSSAMALDADADTNARLLNDVDEFQRVVGGVLDELEKKYERNEGEGKVKKERDGQGAFCRDALSGFVPRGKIKLTQRTRCRSHR